MSPNPSASGKSFFTIEPRSCALIVIDMQNGFVAEGAVFETPGARTMIPRLQHLIQFARASGIPIVWTQSDHRPPYGGNAAQIPSDRGRPHSVARRAEL